MNDSRVRRATPGELTDTQLDLYRRITEGPRARGPQHFALTRPDGSLRGPFDAFLLQPALGAALQELGASIRFSGKLEARVREIAILSVAAHWQSAFEQAAHESVGRAVGLIDAELEALRRQDTMVLAADDRIIADAALQLARAGDLDDRLWGEAEKLVGRDGIFELTVIVGYYAMLALQLRTFRVEG